MKKLETLFDNQLDYRWTVPDGFGRDSGQILIRGDSQYVHLNKDEHDIYSPYSRITRQFQRKPLQNGFGYKIHLTTRPFWKSPNFGRELAIELRNLSPFAIDTGFDLGATTTIVPWGFVLYYWWKTEEEILNNCSDFRLMESTPPKIRNKLDMELGDMRPEYDFSRTIGLVKREREEWQLLVSKRKSIREQQFQEKVPVYLSTITPGSPEDEKMKKEFEKRAKFKEASKKSHEMFSPSKER